MVFEERLRTLRINNGYTQISIADALDVDRSRYAKWETGIARPSIEVIAQICELLNVSADYMLGITDDPTPRDIAADLALAEQMAKDMPSVKLTKQELAERLPEDVRDTVLQLIDVAIEEAKIRKQKK